MAYFLIFFPMAIAALAALFPSNKWRPLFLPLSSSVHLAATIYTLINPGVATSTDWLALDPAGRLVLLTVGTLYFFCSVYCVGYLRIRSERSNRVFVCCMLFFLGIMSLLTWSHHLGLMWVAMEAMTLSTAPLIYFNHSKKSIEATWKYLLVGSVGIALALLGTYFLAYSGLHGGLEPTLQYGELLAHASGLSKPWLRGAFVLLLVGYGTKMGLAPMHTWKPDAYGEAPGVVGAILAGGVTSCAFLAFLRIYHICAAAGEFAFVSRFLLPMGLFSMAVAGLFMLGQRDFKRMLAYSSVEHMGILMVGLGLGAPALFGTMLHIMTNCMTKGVLFLSAGNIHRAYASKNTEQVSGALQRLPFSGAMFLAGFLAITGSPPFGPFISEFAILNGAFDANSYLVAVLFLLFLLLVFIGMGKTVLKVVQGSPHGSPGEIPVSDPGTKSYRDTFFTAIPLAALMAFVILLGIYIPAPIGKMISDAALFLGVNQ